MVDDDPDTWWISEPGKSQSITIDLGEEVELAGFTYYPMQDRWINGVITDYMLEISANGSSWINAATGKFDNILNNPIEQQVMFANPFKARYLKLTGLKSMNEDGRISAAEIGVITK